MITIKKYQDVLNKTHTNTFSNEIIKEILFDVYTFDREFDRTLYPNNEIIILDTDEQYTPPNDVSEFEIDIENYIKKLYIVSDSGEGVIVYQKIKENKNE